VLSFLQRYVPVVRTIAVRNDTTTLRKSTNSLRVAEREVIHGLIIKTFFSLVRGNKVHTGKIKRIARTPEFFWMEDPLACSS
jgi:hypothetical protein